MESIAKSDLFFFITAISVVIITLIVLVIAIYGVFIMSDIKSISKKVKDESIEFLDDAKVLRKDLMKGDSIIKLLSVIFGLRKNKKNEKK